MDPRARPLPAATLAQLLRDAHARTLELFEDLEGERLLGPRLEIVNPPLWEFGHVAWFHERWVLRELRGLAPLDPRTDSLYDSSRVAHETRWDLPLLSREAVVDYLRRVLELELDYLERETPDERSTYFHLLALFHEDMHAEAFIYTRQTLGYPAPRLGVLEPRPWSDPQEPPPREKPPSGDAEFSGGVFLLGALPDAPFVFDNEKWAHPVELRPFRIARAPVTNREFLAFVEDGGYRRPELWGEEGRRWLEASGASQPVYWRREPGGTWLRRHFDRWMPLEDDLPVIHVNWFEAQAYAKWAGRRLPTEAEWELASCAGEGVVDGTGSAAAGAPASAAGSVHKRRYPWGDSPPRREQAALDAYYGGPVSAGAFPAGDNPQGVRQLIGNVWEWTASPFLPYPGFAADPYVDYSRPWFGTRRVLRGGSWATRARLIWNTWRNFFTPERRDIFAGFRTCALDE